MALDGCPGQTEHQQSDNTTMGSDHGFINQDQISRTARGHFPSTSFGPFDAQFPISSDARVTSSSNLSDIKEPERIYTVGLKSVWHWAVAAENFLDYTTDITTHPCERAMTLYRKHFGNTLYDPFVMDELLEQLLEDDQLQEAEEIALLAVELSESWVGQDHVESWKAKGNLASVYHEQGRYPVACQLGEQTLQFFDRNGLDFDASALTFMSNLAQTLNMLQKWSEAKRLCYNVIEFSRREFGEGENTITLTAKLHLAKVCYALNEWHEAKEILEVVTTPRQQEHGFVTAKIVQAYIELAKVLQRLDLKSEALEIQGRLEAVLTNSAEPRSMWTLELVFSVGEQLYNLGHYVGAEQVFRNLVQCTAMRAKSWNHTKVAFAKCWLANSLHYQWRGKEATTVNLECVDILKEALGPYNRLTLTCMSNLAWMMENVLTLVDLEAMVSEVRDLRKEHLGENDPDTLDSEIFCADLMWTRGRWDDALCLLKQVRARLKELPEPKRLYVEWELMDSEAKFFVARGAKGDDITAATKLQNRLDLGQKIFGKEHPLTLRNLDKLARSYSSMGREEEARKLLCNGISSLGETLGREHPAVTKLKARYGAELAFQNQWESAETQQRQILQIYSELGEQHPYVIDATRRLAWSCTQLGRYSEAEELFKQAIKASQTVFGLTYREISILLTDYARMLRKGGNMRDARNLFEELWNIDRKSFGRLHVGDGQQFLRNSKHPHALYNLEGLANVLDATGDYSKSLPLRKQILSIRTQLLGSLDPDTITAISRLAGTTLELGKTREALDLYLDCLDRKCSVWGEWHPKSLAERRGIIKLLRKVKQFTEAEAQCRELLETTKATMGENSVEFAMALIDTGNTHFDQQQYAPAAQYFQQALRILELIGITSMGDLDEAVDAMIGLSICYRKRNEFERAEVQIEAAIQKAQGFLKSDDPIVPYTKVHLAWTYFKGGKYHEAEDMARILLHRMEEDPRRLSNMRLEELFAQSMAGQGKFQSAIDFLKPTISKRRNKNPKDPIIIGLAKVLKRIKADQEAEDGVAMFEDEVSTQGEAPFSLKPFNKLNLTKNPSSLHPHSRVETRYSPTILYQN